MNMRQFIGFLLLVSYAVARPATSDEYLSVEEDIAAVGSTLRNVRAPVPMGFATEVQDLLSAETETRKSRQAKSDAQPKKSSMKNASGKSDEGGYYKTYGSDAEGEKGYLKQTHAKGNQGYKTLDTFHKQDGDNYGFEKHTAFGKASGGEEGGKHGKSGSYTTKEQNEGDDHEGAATIVDAHYSPAEGDHASESYSEGEHYSDGDTSGADGEYHAEGGDAAGHYSDGGEGAHYTSGGDGNSGSYSSGGETGEHYSSGNGGEGSYGTHGSYSSGDDAGDHQAYDSGAGYEGDHY